MSRTLAHAFRSLTGSLKTHLVVVAALAAPSLAHAAAWDIDPAHSAAAFSVRHMMISNVRGEFGKVGGTIEWDGKKGSVDATIDATTINTRDEKRDGHLKSPDFFDVAKFPTITFKSTKIVAHGGKLAITGDLTIHGVTRPVVVEAEVSRETKDPWGMTRVGASGSTKINRKDFNLVWNKALETGGVVVGEEVQITLDIEMTKRAPAAAAVTK